VRPVLQAVADRAASLCDAPFAFVVLVDGDELKPAAAHSTPDPASGYADPIEMKGPFPITRTLAVGRATIDRTTIHLPDVLPVIDTEYPAIGPIQARYGFRALLVVPLMREGGVYGVILVWRREARAFSPIRSRCCRRLRNRRRSRSTTCGCSTKRRRRWSNRRRRPKCWR
jgi:hypothetical protein